jgi:hypothetical protein
MKTSALRRSGSDVVQITDRLLQHRRRQSPHAVIVQHR